MEVIITFLMITDCFVENVVVVTFQRLLGSLLNLTFIFTQVKLHRWSLSLSSVLFAIYELKQFSVHEGSCRNYSPESFGLFEEAFRYVFEIKKKALSSEREILVTPEFSNELN